MLCCGVPRKSKHKISDSLSEKPIVDSSKKSSSGNLGGGKERLDSYNSLSLMIQWAHDMDLFEEESVLKHIFSFLTVNELLKMRLVNRKWNEYACEVLRDKMEGVIILQRGLAYYLKMMASSIEIPIGRIFLNILDMDEPQPKKFFRILGHSIYYLVLNLEGHSVPQFQTSLRYLKNMKQLSVNLFNQHQDEDDVSDSGTLLGSRVRRKTLVVPDIHILIEDYDEANNNSPLQLFLPNLESIILSCESNWKSNEPFLLDQLMRAAENLKNLNLRKWPFPLRQDLFERPTLQNLQFLTVRYLGNHDLDTLSKKTFFLKSADFQLDYNVEQETFDAFLDNVSQSLQYLTVSSQSNPNLVFRTRSAMSQLLTIRLIRWIGPIWLDTIAGNCSNLSKALMNFDPSSVSIKNRKSNHNVKCLALNFGNSTISAKTEVVKHFIYAFPQLDTLMMTQVSDKVLGQIVKFEHLKTLKITTNYGLTDSALTGIPVSELAKMTKIENKLSCGCCLPVPVVDSKPRIDDLRQYPHIGELRNLIDLSIESEEGSHFPLTNFSLHLGIHELTNLRSLKITCHNELGPHWCLRCIADNLPNLEELTVMDRAVSLDRYEEHEVLYLLRKLPNLKLHLIPTTIDHTS